MKTPTPEEVKDRVAIGYGYENWKDAISDFYVVMPNNEINTRIFVRMENEAMQEYAEAYHKAEVGKGALELPDFKTLLEDFPNLNNQEQIYVKYGWDRMKEQASVVIIKERHKSELTIHDLAYDLEQYRIQAEQKDKELEDFKNILDECRLQFEYLNGKFGETGTTNKILSIINNTKTK